MSKVKTKTKTAPELASLNREHGRDLPATAASGMSASASEVTLPAHVTVGRNLGALEISIKAVNGWRQTLSTLSGFAFVMIALIFIGSREERSTAFIGAIAAAMVLLSAYTVVAQLLNTTTVTVDPKKVVVAVGPVRIFNRTTVYPTADITQFYVRQIVRKDDEVPLLAVSAALEDGDSIDILTGLETVEQARICEDLIEKELGIEDKEVWDELGFHEKGAYGFGKSKNKGG